ncbi:ABC transporter [Shigella flexneri]|nr:ABC transporter [Escherichia coli]ASQ64965.1 ABC transporter [Shigella flexneri 1a]OOO73622.1 ABC transporter [Shigella boydii]OUZ48110.1 ABC transporter [Shigella flexneri]OKV05095.1 ABC transporter [Escherichia coli]
MLNAIRKREPNGRKVLAREGANKQVISSQADSLIKISRIWADFFPANTSNQPI